MVTSKCMRGEDVARGCLSCSRCAPLGHMLSCKWSHDIDAYLASKGADILLAPPPFAAKHANPAIALGSLRALDDAERTAYLDQRYMTTAPYVIAPEATTCPLYHSTESRKLWDASSSSRPPFCPFGFKCRFLSAHGGDRSSGRSAAQDGDEASARRIGDETNYVRPGLFKELRQAKSGRSNSSELFSRTKAIVAALTQEDKEYQKTGVDPTGPLLLGEEAKAPVPAAAAEEDLDALANGDLDAMVNARVQDAATSQSSSSVDRTRLRRSEKRKLDWYHNELYLAPLTTVGNLPFRRLCSTFGSDIHCGEMGLASSYLDGHKSEWSLARRWEGERTFGIQLCGSRPELLVPTAEVMAREFGEQGGLDFVDVNCGCPIDLVFKQGAGSALLDHPRKLGRIVRGMDAALGDVPVTVKLRTGVTDKKTSHTRILPRVQTEWGAAAVAMHGRSRKQRYSKRADWDYIRECAGALRDSVRQWNEESKHADEEEMRPIPVSTALAQSEGQSDTTAPHAQVIGNGDVYSQSEYWSNLSNTTVDVEMLARGALIKPWLFTEIKERRDWDISSRERLDMIRQYCHYGLSHWGSDTQGVNTTRRFVCEAMSFWHRYVPLGLLEHLPPSMNDRPPPYKGRDDLETLLASGNVDDWVKLSEMFLGKAPNEWQFTPKHKSNSYGSGADAGDAEQQG